MDPVERHRLECLARWMLDNPERGRDIYRRWQAHPLKSLVLANLDPIIKVEQEKRK